MIKASCMCRGRCMCVRNCVRRASETRRGVVVASSTQCNLRGGSSIFWLLDHISQMCGWEWMGHKNTKKEREKTKSLFICFFNQNVYCFLLCWRWLFGLSCPKLCTSQFCFTFPFPPFSLSSFSSSVLILHPCLFQTDSNAMHRDR